MTRRLGRIGRGEREIRDTIIEAAKAANESAHAAISEKFTDFVKSKELKSLPGWYCHELRILVTALLANPTCGEAADESLNCFSITCSKQLWAPSLEQHSRVMRPPRHVRALVNRRVKKVQEAATFDDSVTPSCAKTRPF